MTQMKLTGAFLVLCGALSAQGPQNQDENAVRMAAGSTPIYRVTVTARTTKAINYQHRSGATKIDFRGTELLPKARGEAKVESKQGYIEMARGLGRPSRPSDRSEARTRNGSWKRTKCLLQLN